MHTLKTLTLSLLAAAPLAAQEFAADMPAARDLVARGRDYRAWTLSHQDGILQQIDAALAHLTAVSKPSVAMIRTPKGLGTGFVVDASGLLVTNAHVVLETGLNGKVAVVFAEGTVADGVVSAIGTMGTNADPLSGRDLALVTIPPRAQGWPALPLGDAASLKEGNMVVMMGYPLGLPFTVTQGVVGGTEHRDGGVKGFPVQFVQSDAAINPGNSGGPLLSMDGKVMGVNTLTLAPNGGASGLGFSVGVDAVKRFVDEYRARGSFRDPGPKSPLRPRPRPAAGQASCPSSDALTKPWVEHRGPAPRALVASHLAAAADAAAPMLVPFAGTAWWVGASRRGRGPESGIADPACFALGTAALYANGPEDAPAVDFVAAVAAGAEDRLGEALVELRWFDPADGRKHRWFDADRARALGWPSGNRSPLPLPEAVNELL